MDKGVGMIYKKKYCNENYELCARYKVLIEVGESFVSDNLYPNMHDIALNIIEEAKKM